MYELFVLGELMTGDKHGYLLQNILKNAVGPNRRISSGTLYPLINRLIGNGWIRLRDEEGAEGGRARKIYQLTEAGEERFQELMHKPLEHNADIDLVFHFKMVYFGYVPQDVRLACLEQYLQYLQYDLKYVTDCESKLISAQPSPEKQRLQLLRMIDHRKHVTTADIEWIQEEIKRITAEEC
jgi:DNA-binding PadR family transcriptional regulator